MPFGRRSNKSRKPADEIPYEEATRNRLRTISESGGYDYAEEESGEVEARLRRMFYGARVEGSKAADNGEEGEASEGA